MIGKILGAVIGSKIDRQDGKGGFKGALLGYAGAALVKRVLKLGLAIGGGIAAKRMVDRRRIARR